MVALDAIRRKRDAILRIAEQHGARDVRVCGSVARADVSNHTDLELLVRLDADRTLLDLAGLLLDLRDLLSMRVEIVTDDALRGSEGGQILKEAIAL
jgi:predicted nucleotidyltransferase